MENSEQCDTQTPDHKEYTIFVTAFVIAKPVSHPVVRRDKTVVMVVVVEDLVSCSLLFLTNCPRDSHRDKQLFESPCQTASAHPDGQFVAK